MKQYIGPRNYSTSQHTTQAHAMPISFNQNNLFSMVGTVTSIKAKHDRELEKQADAVDKAQKHIDSELKRAEAERQHAEDNELKRRELIENKRQKEEDRISHDLRLGAIKANLETLKQINADHEFDRRAEEYFIRQTDMFGLASIDNDRSNELRRERAEIARDAAIERQENRDLATAFRQQKEDEKRLLQNEVDIANQAEYFDTQLDKFAISQINSNRPGSTKPAISQLEKDAISMLENYGYNKQEAASRVASVYQEGMSEEDLLRAALRG